MLFVQQVLALITFITAHIPLDGGRYTELVRGLTTCTHLRATLGENVVASSGARYRAGASSAWNLFNTQHVPVCVVFPRETSHVQAAMKAIYNNKLRYAVQAGGHSAMKGWNNVHYGILISFSEMKNVTYNPDNESITLQPGVSWEDAIAAVEPHGVAPLGGRVGIVGTGLLLGGGLNYLSPQYGFSADLLRELDVVLVTGELVTAAVTNEYADLFRALKGGANRFGIVTRYEVDAVHTGTKHDERWFGGMIFYPDSSAEALVNATAHYVQDVKDPKAALLVGLAYINAGATPIAYHFAALFYEGHSLPTSIFSQFLSIPSTSRALGPRSYQNVSATLGTGDLSGYGQLFGASALNGGTEQYLDTFRLYRNFSINSMLEGQVFANVLAFTPVLESQIEAGRRRGGNVIFGDEGLGSFSAVQVQTQLAAGVTEVPEEVERRRRLFLKHVPRSRGLPLYVNECDKQQNVFQTYVGYEELKRTYIKYDPTRFNVEYTDGPIGL